MTVLVLTGCASHAPGASAPTETATSSAVRAATDGPAAASGPPSPSVAGQPPGKVAPPRDRSAARIVDVSFAGEADGWLLLSVPCTAAPSRSCAEMRRTTDGGRHWTRTGAPRAPGSGAEGCSRGCVQQLAFASARVGYAYGADALFLTTDGGASWRRQPGGVDGLAIAGHTVVRLVSDHGGCPGPCDLRAEIAPVGGSHWTAVQLPGGPINAGGVRIAGTAAGDVYLETSQGQAGSLYSVRLYVSTDRGRTWTRRADPCRSAGSTAAGVPMASSQWSVAPADGSLSILCTSGGDTRAVAITSSDGGASFTAGRVVATTDHGLPLGPIGTASARVLVSATGTAGLGLYRSTDGGRNWTRAQKVSGNGDVLAPEFVSATTGHWIAPDGRTLWTTRDGGASWTALTIG